MKVASGASPAYLLVLSRSSLYQAATISSTKSVGYHPAIGIGSNRRSFSSVNNIRSSFVSSYCRRSSVRMSSSGKDDKEESEVATLENTPPLIDVDCNLVHPDLKSLLSSSTNPLYCKEDNGGNGIDPTLRILHHPSTSQSNIQAVFSPTSTLDEARSFLQDTLIPSTSQSRNSIQIKTSIGVHPYHAADAGPADEAAALQIRSLLRTDADSPQTNFISCIGETGLDYSEGFPAKELQIPWFRLQLHLASELHLPLFLHTRSAFRDTLQAMDDILPPDTSIDSVPVLVHCFTGSAVECAEYVSRGYHLSLSGFILKSTEQAEEIRRCLKDGILPLDRLMIETDAPYMGFGECRKSYYEAMEGNDPEFDALNGKKKKRLLKGIYPNVPSALVRVFDCVVECVNEGRSGRGETLLTREEIGTILFQNSVKFFGFQF